MQLTMKAKLLPIKEHADLLKLASQEYIRLVNQVVTDCIEAGKTLKYTSATVPAALPSAVKNQAIRDGKSVYRKYRKTKIQSILKKPVCIWNNQNWKLKEGMLCFPVLIEGKSKRIAIPVLMTNYQTNRIPGMDTEAAIRTQIWGFRNFVGSEDMISRMSEFLNRKK